MSNWILYYNPRCGSCRKAKEKLETQGIKPQVIEYLKTPPTVEELDDILKKLGTGPSAITRFKESVWKEKGKNPSTFDKKAWVKLISKNPILLERPIVIYKNKALVARPPDKLDSFIKEIKSLVSGKNFYL